MQLNKANQHGQSSAGFESRSDLPVICDVRRKYAGYINIQGSKNMNTQKDKFGLLEKGNRKVVTDFYAPDNITDEPDKYKNKIFERLNAIKITFKNVSFAHWELRDSVPIVLDLDLSARVSLPIRAIFVLIR